MPQLSLFEDNSPEHKICSYYIDKNIEWNHYNEKLITLMRNIALGIKEIQNALIMVVNKLNKLKNSDQSITVKDFDREFKNLDGKINKLNALVVEINKLD